MDALNRLLSHMQNDQERNEDGYLCCDQEHLYRRLYPSGLILSRQSRIYRSFEAALRILEIHGRIKRTVIDLLPVTGKKAHTPTITIIKLLDSTPIDSDTYDKWMQDEPQTDDERKIRDLEAQLAELRGRQPKKP